MKTEISRDSHKSDKRYSGVYQQQGRMLTDADWNELVEILKGRLNDALKDIVGNKEGSVGGTPRHHTLKLIKALNADPLSIMPGLVYVDGIAAQIPGETNILYDEQFDFPSAPPASLANYTLYVDVWERTVTHLMDEYLRDVALHGADTCSRKQMLAQIKWCPVNIDPETASVNPSKGDAPLSLTLSNKTTEADACDPCASQLEIDSTVGNYLFRFEVHDVKGDADSPSEITLKWSSENGAEQFEAFPTAEEMPAGFVNDKSVYEFFDLTTEKHLGVHLNNNLWQPARCDLKELTPSYAVPTITGSNEENIFVRRWDGYCKINLMSNTLVEGFDKSIILSTDKLPDALGYMEITNTLLVNLNFINVKLQLNGKSFVAGDFWLADVREAKHDPLDEEKSKLIVEQLPSGIEHHYLTLGRIESGVLLSNPETDRKYAFPALTEMTRLFMAGGDGQEIVPGEALPQRLRVGVANGEWPVEGASVRFHIEEGAGTLNVVNGGITDVDGIAECEWSPDSVINAKHSVSAKLVDPDFPLDPNKDFEPPVYFYANLITADQVAYEPACPDSGENAVHTHLASDASVSLDIGADNYYTVKEVLDALLCKLKAKHIPYDASNVTRWNDVNQEEGALLPETVQQAIDALLENLHSEDIKYIPSCIADTPISVRSKLEIPTVSSSRVSFILDKILCDFNAIHLPVDRDNLCTRLKSLTDDKRVDTVQDAINALCETNRSGCCTINIVPGDDIQARCSSEINAGEDAHICITEGEYFVSEPVKLDGLGHITIQGCGKGSAIKSSNSEIALIVSNSKNVTVRNLALESYKLGTEPTSENDHLNGALTIIDADDVAVESVSISCPNGGIRMASCLTVTSSSRTSSVRINNCQFNPGHQQVGVLLNNAYIARIEDNEIKVRPKPKKSKLKSLIKNKKYRLTIRKMFLSDVVVVTGDTPSDNARNVEFRYGNRLLRFNTPENLINVWLDVFKKLNFEDDLHNRDVIRVVKQRAEDIILTLAASDNIPRSNIAFAFQSWFREMKISLPSIASQGVVCGGRIANDICISNNSILGVAQGIHIGLSDYKLDVGQTFNAGRLLLTGNRVVNYFSSQALGEWHGIFVGNFESLHVENNFLELKKFPFDLDSTVRGIRLHGYFGGMLQVRGNRLSGYDPGIFAKAVNASKEEVHLWQVENNLLQGSSIGPVLVPQPSFIFSNNPY